LISTCFSRKEKGAAKPLDWGCGGSPGKCVKEARKRKGRLRGDVRKRGKKSRHFSFPQGNDAGKNGKRKSEHDTKEKLRGGGCSSLCREGGSVHPKNATTVTMRKKARKKGGKEKRSP